MTHDSTASRPAGPLSARIDTSSLPAPLVGPVEGRDEVFAWRGVMIDSARSRFDVETIKTVIKLAHRYGLNVVHWHLTDDAGWRYKVDEYPLLETVAAQVPRSSFDHYNCLAGDSAERGQAEAETRWEWGVYTDEEIGEVVDLATELGVEIVPELDLPGHMEAAIAAYPELGRPEGSPLPTESVRDNMEWAARNDLLWPTDQAKKFIAACLDKLVALFPGKRVHLGGDECAYRQWTSDEWLTNWMAEMGYDKPQQVQKWFFDFAKEHLAARGRTVVAWDEICDVTDDPSIEVIAWDEHRGLARIEKTTNDVIFADARFLYLNRIDPSAAEPQKGMVPGFTVDDVLTAPWPLTQTKRCIGIECCLWAEFILDGKDLISMLLPRFLAIVERMWHKGPAPDDAADRIRAEYEVVSQAITFSDSTESA